MRNLPSGTVTFVFTDIEGSTKLLHELGPEGFAAALAEHRRLLREAFGRHGGVEVDTQGDAFFYAFGDARRAVLATEEGREALRAGPIHVRVGLHTGTPHLTGEGYIGHDVHLGARIGAAGHGGQVLLSEETRRSARLEGDDRVVDLGEHRLKDFTQPISIFQLGSERFPPLKTISNTNLPRPASSFVGREREVGEIVALLRDRARLVTLTGPGGSGKTRLSIEAAAELIPDHKAGTFWVELAPLRDPSLVTGEIAKTLGVQDGLADHVGEREMLLVLDNFEQVIEAAPDLASLVESCPNLRMLVTSRERLRVRGEVEYPVAPLAEPDAAELFLARGGLADADEAIHELCRALDDMPLAIELAAARTSVLTPSQILERISQRLDLLKGGRDADPRQRTLRSTIEWSHDLLDSEEQRLFGRLAVFVGGCTLEGAEQVVDADIDTLQSLVEKSLVRHTGDRFWMYETIREFALERLEASGESHEIQMRRRDFFVALVEGAYESRLEEGPRRSPILEAERGNIRAALDHARTTRPEAEAQLAGAVAYYWLERGYGPETRDRLSDVVARYATADRFRARALTHLGDAVGDLGNDQEALIHLFEAVDLWRELGDPFGEAGALASIGYCRVALGELSDARAAFERGIELCRGAGASELEVAQLLAGLCQVLMASGRTVELERRATELRELAVRHGSERIRQSAMAYLSDRALLDGDFEEAEVRYVRALGHARANGIHVQSATKLMGVAMSAAGRGDLSRAVRLAASAEAELRELGVTSSNMAWEELQRRFIGGAREVLGTTATADAERAGTSIDFETVIDGVLGDGA